MNVGLTSEVREKAFVIRFDRPKIRNPLSIPVLESLTSIFADGLEGFKAVIFTGTGDVFASGADLREIAAVTPEIAGEFALRGQDIMNRIADLPQPTIAAINGICFGGALDLAIACRHRIASPNAVFSHPGANLGIITGWGGTQRLPRLVGQANALEMFFTAGRVDADEALRIGLVDMIAENALDAALAIASDS